MNFMNSVNGLCSKFKFLAQLFSRVVIGIVFMSSGWWKLHNLSQVIEFFKSLSIPVPEWHAPFVAGMELVCGAAILLGIFTQIASVPLIVIMVMAIVTAKMGDIKTLSDLLEMSEFLYIGMLLWLMAEGAGPISLSAPFCKKKAKK